MEIYFNFIGRYVPPNFGEVTLTQEEQEEQRKKEERKDKIHQNYLRRKASGSQKAWEEKYNARRKAKWRLPKRRFERKIFREGCLFLLICYRNKHQKRHLS